MSQLSELHDFLNAMSTAPDTQIDSRVVIRLKELTNYNNTDDIIDELIVIRDDCVFASLCSDFVIKALSIVIDSHDSIKKGLVTTDK